MSLFKGKKILILGAHSDDEVLGVGGTILKAKDEGAIVDVLILTDSTSTQYSNNETKKKHRGNSLVDCCDVLQVDNVYQWHLPDMRLDTLAHVDLNKKLEKFMNENKYEIVFVHHPHDINKDHQIVFETLFIVTRPTPFQSVTKIFTYYTPSSTEWGGFSPSTIFCPNFYIDINQYLEKKIMALSKYKDELREYPHPRSIDNVRNMSKYFGSQVGLDAVEAFNLIRSIER